MKTIIAGSRGITSQRIVDRAIMLSHFHITEVVSGGASGVDKKGEDWALRHRAPIKRFIPDWDKLGKRAGFVRNAEMAKYADALIAVWDGVSKGTANMIATARQAGLKVYVFDVREEEKKP